MKYPKNIDINKGEVYSVRFIAFPFEYIEWYLCCIAQGYGEAAMKDVDSKYEYQLMLFWNHLIDVLEVNDG